METGLRVSDILQLRYRDIENPMRVYVSRIDRIVPYRISDWLYTELISHTTAWSPDNYIFPSRRKFKRHLHRTTYHRDIKLAAGTDFDCSAHTTRKIYLSIAAETFRNSTDKKTGTGTDRTRPLGNGLTFFLFNCRSPRSGPRRWTRPWPRASLLGSAYRGILVARFKKIISRGIIFFLRGTWKRHFQSIALCNVERW